MSSFRQATLILIGISLLAITTPSFAKHVRHMVWHKTILPIQLPIGQDKIIEVCQSDSSSSNCQTADVIPYLPQKLIAQGQLKLINNHGTLYLQAAKPFKHQLAELKIKTSGDIILVRLTATKQGNDDRIAIMLPKPSSPSDQSHQSQSIHHNKTIGQMISWAIRQRYAPKRLLSQPNWVYRVPMQTQHFVSLYQGGTVSSMPLASFKAGDYYITVVLMRNTLSQRVHLSYDLLRGQWVAVSFFRLTQLDPAILTPHRTYKDTTTAILISSAPFRVALKQGAAND